MDPLSLAVSVLTLTGMAIQTVQGLEKLRQAFGAEDKLLELLNEVADFRTLLSIISDVAVTHDSNAAPIKAILQILNRAELLLLELNRVITQILKSPAEDSGSSAPKPHIIGPERPRKVSRRAWLLREKKLLGVRESLRDVRHRLHIAISVFTSGQLPQITLHLHSISSTASSIAAQQRSMTDRMDQQDAALAGVQEFLEKLAASESQLSQRVSCQTSLTSSAETETQMVRLNEANTTSNEGRLSKLSSKASSVYSTRRAPSICIKTSVRGSRQCLKPCPCRCHLVSHARTPLWMNNIFGLLFMGYSGVPRMNVVTCDNRRCNGSEDSNLVISYYFPPWLAARMVNVIIKSLSQVRPSMAVRMLRVVPHDAPIFLYIRQGDIQSLQSLFQRRLATPMDISAQDGRSPLHIALYAGQPETAKFLLDQDADREYEDRYFNSAIGASWEMTFQKLPTLLPSTIGGSTEDTDFLDNREFSILHRIVLGLTSIPLREQLQHSTADIDVRDVSGRTALHWASVRGDMDAIRTLLEFGANPNILSDASWSPLHHAATSDVPETLDLLLRDGAKVDERNNRGHTALSIVALVHDDTRFLDPLYSFGADLHSINHEGQTSLHRAALRDNVQTAKWLLERGADRDQADNMGYTAVHQCVKSASHKTLAVLLDARCYTGAWAKDGRTILHDAAAYGDIETLTLLTVANLDSIDIDSNDSHGMNSQAVFNALRHEHLAEDETQRLQSMRLFESLLQNMRRIGKLPGHQHTGIRPGSDDEFDNFFDAAEKMESSLGSLLSLQPSVVLSEKVDMPGAWH